MIRAGLTAEDSAMWAGASCSLPLAREREEIRQAWARAAGAAPPVPAQRTPAPDSPPPATPHPVPRGPLAPVPSCPG
jgi:hypothetical protein